MPTEEWFKTNPKISAYTSQTIYERLKQFASDRRSSISQALTAVLAEYFAVDQEVDRTFVGGVTLAQLQAQKEELDKLSETINQKLVLMEQRFLELETRIESVEVGSKPVDQSKSTIQPVSSLTSEPIDEPSSEAEVTVPEIVQALQQNEESKSASLDNEPLAEGVEVNTQTEWQEVNSTLLSELKSELLSEETEESEQTDETKVILPIQPLSTKELSQRLGVDSSTVTRYKNGKYKQSLSEWSQSKDSNQIAWQYDPELKLYYPVELISKPVDKLLNFEVNGDLSS